MKIVGGMKPRVDIAVHKCIALCWKFAKKFFCEPKQKIIKKFDKVRVRFAMTNSHLIRFDSIQFGKRLKFASFAILDILKTTLDVV